LKSLLCLQDMSFAYPGQAPLLRNINLCLHPGEAAVLTGASGSGKSTLCAVISGIIPAHTAGRVHGAVLLAGKPLHTMRLPEVATRVGLLFQNPDTQLFSITVEDELAFAPENLCLDRLEIARRVDRALDITGIRHLRHARISRLSGGEKQLTALAAVLTLDAQLLLLDEPLAHLDQQAARRVISLAADLRRCGKAILWTAHRADSFPRADRCFTLRQGTLSPVAEGALS